MESSKLTSHFDHDGSEHGKQILERVRSHLKSALWESGGIRQGMAPEAVREIIDFEAIANRGLPSDPSLRMRITEALQEHTGWSLTPDVLNAAVAKWLSEEMEDCLREIWESRCFVKIRVTRHEISIEEFDGRGSPNVGRLPQSTTTNAPNRHF